MSESVAVVIVTHNRADLLTRMLDGLVAQTRPVDAVYVIDNASTDHTAEVLHREQRIRGDRHRRLRSQRPSVGNTRRRWASVGTTPRGNSAIVTISTAPKTIIS